MPLGPPLPIRDRLGSAVTANRWLWGATRSVSLDALIGRTCLQADPAGLVGASVLVATHDPLSAAIALIELDGVADRLVIGTPDLGDDAWADVLEAGEVGAIITDTLPLENVAGGRPLVFCNPDDPFRPRWNLPARARATEWVLLTSGTSGKPKLVVHTLDTLSGAIVPAREPPPDLVWGTFYDIRRYGGMQILLRALLGGGSFVVSGAGEPAADYLARLAAHGATHISGTATHWRRALMSPAAGAVNPQYVRLSGEIADQGILNSLRSFYAGARVAHAFASTEAGLAFEVNDGLEGFPVSILEGQRPVHVRIEDGSLRVQSNRTALAYLDGKRRRPVADAEGFVDTGDMLERRGDRYYFLGRRTGVINVGGLKVYPEEVEAAINRHPAVRMSLVRSRRNPITGALVAADVVLRHERSEAGGDSSPLRREILQLCRETLAPHKIPASLRFVPELDVASAGKLVRSDA